MNPRRIEPPRTGSGAIASSATHSGEAPAPPRGPDCAAGSERTSETGIRTDFSPVVVRPGVSFIPGEKRVLLPVYFSVLGTWAGYALLVVVLPFRFQELGLTVVEYGAALAIYALGTLATEGLWGYLAFRIGSARSLGALGAVTAVSMLALGFARSFLVLSLLLGLYGMLVVYSTPLLRWIGMRASGPGKAGLGLGRLGLFFGVGLSAGTAVGPLIYSIGGFWTNVYVGTALFVISTIPLLFVPWGSVRLPLARPKGQSSLRALTERRFILAIVLVVLFFMIYTLVTNFL